ncbi:MAG TPA: GYF domain-containing protein [Verrucomicrobiae bacterium]|nr:GYF domain-containing protein [Verrucomicrobiae bacterium]
MNWYYVDDGQQAGPVDDSQLAELVRSGKIQAEGLVWHEGMGAWAPYREVAPPGNDPGTPPLIGAPPPQGGAVLCSQCGRSFALNEVIRYADKFVCAECKPLFFQRVREGAVLGPGGLNGTATDADVLGRDYEVDIGGSLSRAWEVFKANAGILIGGSVLVYMALFAINIVPYLNVPLALVFSGPLMGGLWLLYIRAMRSQSLDIGTAFGGFGPRFWQLTLTQLIPGLIVMGTIALVVFVAIIMGVTMATRRPLQTGFPISFPHFVVPLVIVGVIAFGVITYLNVCWLFALPLAADKGLKFWPALELSRRVVNKHWWMTFVLALLLGFLIIAGVMACGLGLLLTGPLAFAMLAAHYEKVFGDLVPSPN